MMLWREIFLPTLAMFACYLKVSKADVNVCQLPTNRRLKLNVSCDFETAGCSARFTSSMSHFWEFKSGPIGTQFYGRINGDRIRGDSGRYCLFDTHNFFPAGGNNTDQLLPPPVPYSDICLSFWYNLPAKTSNIKVIADGREFFRRVNNVTHGWFQETISIKGKAPLQVKFESTKMSIYGYVGIDDIIVEIENPAQPSIYQSTVHTALKLLSPYSTKSASSTRSSLRTKSAFTTMGRTPRTATRATKHTGLSTVNATNRTSGTITIPTMMTTKVSLIKPASTTSTNSAASIMTTKESFTTMSMTTRNVTRAPKGTTHITITTINSTRTHIATPAVATRKIAPINIMPKTESRTTIATRATTDVSSSSPYKPSGPTTQQSTRTLEITLANIMSTTGSRTTIATSATTDVSSLSPSKSSGPTTKQSTRTLEITPANIVSTTESRTAIATRATTAVSSSSPSKPSAPATKQSTRTPTVTPLHIIWETTPINVSFPTVPRVTTRTILPTETKITINSRTTNSINTPANSLNISHVITRLETKSLITTLITSRMIIAKSTPPTTLYTTVSTSNPTKATDKIAQFSTTSTSLSIGSTQAITPKAPSVNTANNSTISPFRTISATLTKRYSFIRSSRTTLQDTRVTNPVSTFKNNYTISTYTPETETNAIAETNFHNPSETNAVSSKRQDMKITVSTKTVNITQGNPSLSQFTLRKVITQVTSTLSAKTTSSETKRDINIKEFSVDYSHAKHTMIIVFFMFVAGIVVVVILFLFIVRYKSRRMSTTFIGNKDNDNLFDDTDDTSGTSMIQLQRLQIWTDIS